MTTDLGSLLVDSPGYYAFPWTVSERLDRNAAEHTHDALIRFLETGRPATGNIIAWERRANVPKQQGNWSDFVNAKVQIAEGLDADPADISGAVKTFRSVSHNLDAEVRRTFARRLAKAMERTIGMRSYSRCYPKASPELSMLKNVKSVLRPAVAAWRENTEKRRWDGFYRESAEDLDVELHLREAAGWLARAQDAGADRGVAYGTRFGEAFDHSYPETTGYIIPTYLQLADYWRDESWRQRAIEAGDWEIAIQMPSGAVMGGKINPNPTPAIFNTGMVLLGWAALAQDTGEERFRAAAKRASDWMVEMQDPDGNWFRGNSEFAQKTATIYNVKAAWGLCEAGKACSGDAAVQAAIRNAEFCLSRQLPNGWFSDCCLTDPVHPLLHTIAYSAQGLLGIGLLTGRQDFIDGARRTAESVMGLMASNGFIPGRFDSSFQGSVNWCCLTGSAQISIVWAKLFELTNMEIFRESCRTVNRYLMQRHDIAHQDAAIRGGVPGSWPTSGGYGRHTVLNWATNFFAEALLAERRIFPETA